MHQLVGNEENEAREIFLSFPQVCGILDIDQALFYGAMQDIECPKKIHGGRKKKIKVIPASIVGKLADLTSQAKWRESKAVDQQKKLHKLAESLLYVPSTKFKVKTIAHRVNSVAQRHFTKLSLYP